MTGILVVFHIVTAGKQGDDLGTDETSIVLITIAIYDTILSKSIKLEQYHVSGRNEPMTEEEKTQTRLLTEDCCLETSLNDSMFISAQSLSFVLKDLHKSLIGIGIPSINQCNFCLVTDGQAPLRLAFHPEIARNNIDLTNYDYYFNFIDLRKEFQRFYNKEKSLVLDEMIQECNIFINDSGGNYGIIQCHKMLEIVRKMTDDGFKWKETETVAKHYYSSIVRKSDYVSDEVVVRARGLPWQATDSDINKFFRGLNIEKGGIALVLSKVGRRNGEALIRFKSREHRDMALRKHKHHMGQRYIEVYMATGRDFIQVAGGDTEEAEVFLQRITKPSQTLIRMRGLPYTATANQILEFFTSTNCPVEFGEDGILFVNHKDGRATGDAFVIFENEEIAEEALKSHRENIGNRYIELFKSTPAEVNQVMNSVLIPAPSPPAIDDPSLIATLTMNGNLISLLPNQIPVINSPCLDQLNLGRTFVRIKGMPLETTVADIINFLEQYGQYISFQGAHIIYNSMGQPAGEAIIQMISEQTAALVVEAKHKQLISISSGKKSMVDVSACSGLDIAQFSGFIQTPNQAQTQIQMQNALYQLQLLQKQFVSSGIAINQVPYPSYWPCIPTSHNTAINNILNNAAPANHILHSPLMGGYFYNIPVPGQAPRIQTGLQTPSMVNPLNPCNNSYLQTPLSHSQPPGLMFSATNSPTTFYIPNMGVLQTHNNCQEYAFVVLKNLPKDITLEEIINIFDPVIQQGITITDIKVGITSDNSATGEAFVAFLNRLDAEKSVIECQSRYVRNVPIDISLL